MEGLEVHQELQAVVVPELQEEVEILVQEELDQRQV
jgi:hypothetical protein